MVYHLMERQLHQAWHSVLALTPHRQGLRYTQGYFTAFFIVGKQGDFPDSFSRVERAGFVILSIKRGCEVQTCTSYPLSSCGKIL